MKKKSAVEKHFDKIAQTYDTYKTRNKFYYSNLKLLLSTLIPTNSNIFEIGCGTGDLIAHLNPTYGFGFDISSKMIAKAKMKHKSIYFSTKWPKRKFKYIFMSDVVEHLENPDKTFSNISKSMNKDSIFICTMANPILEPVLMIAEKLKLKMPEGVHKRIDYAELKQMLHRAGLKVKRHDYKLLIPISIPFVTQLANKYLEPYLRRFSFIEYFTATKI